MQKQDSSWHRDLVSVSDHVGLGRAAHRCLLVGPPGTGKSSAASVLAGAPWRAGAQRDIHRLAISGGTIPDDLVGGWRLDADAGGSRTVWSDGPIARGMLGGGIVVLDEIDQASAELVPCLHALLDDAAIGGVTAGDRRITPAPGFALVLTSNASPSRIASTIVDRCEIVLRALAPCEDAYSVLPPDIRSVTRAAYATARAVAWAWSAPITMRRMLALARLRAAVGELAYSLVLADAASETSVAVLAAVAAAALAETPLAETPLASGCGGAK